MKSGEQVLHYRLEREVGRGGMGAVWLAVDTRLERQVALKFLIGFGDLEDEAGQRLAREARAASALTHPGVVTVHAIESGERGPFVVMEYVRGERLDRWARDRGCTPREALELARQAAEAVGAAHAAGVVHRDLKPSNIHVDDRGRVRVLDFGLATVRDGPQLTKTGSTVGTLGYIAPEQLRGERVGPAADVFALGVVLYELLAGEPLFDRGQGAPGVIHDVLEREVPGLAEKLRDLPAGVDGVLARALAKDPAERYPDCRALAAALEESLAGTAPGVGAPAERAARRRTSRWLWPVVIVALALMGAGLVAAAAFVRLMSGGVEQSEEPQGVAPVLVQAPSGPRWTPRPAGIFAPGQRDPHFSPDGSRLAFVAPVDGVPQLHVTSLEDPAPLRLTDEARPVSRPRWAPDGRSILYAVDGAGDRPEAQSLHLIPVLGGQTRRLVGPARFPAWHPSGDWFAYEWAGLVRRFDLATAESTPLDGFPSTSGGDFARMVAFAPDGERLAYCQSELGPLATLWEFELATERTRRLVDDRSRLRDPVWFPDGERIAFTSDFDGGLTLYVVDRSEQGVRRLTEGLGSDLSPTVDAAAERLAYVNVREEYRLVTLDPATDERQVLLTSRNPILAPRFDPDGRRIAFFGGPGRGADVFLIPVDGGNPERLQNTPEATDVFPFFAPDGRSIYYYTEGRERSALVRAPLDGGPVETVREGWSMQRRSFADLAPDGRSLSVFDVDALETRVVDLGSDATFLLDSWIFRARWSPAGDRLVGTDRDGTIVEVDLVGGATTGHVRGEVPTYGPDGRIYFLRNESLERELFALDPETDALTQLGSLGTAWDPTADLLDVGPRGLVVWSEFSELGSEIQVLERVDPGR